MWLSRHGTAAVLSGGRHQRRLTALTPSSEPVASPEDRTSWEKRGGLPGSRL